MSMVARRVFALSLLGGVLIACSGLIGIEGLTADPRDAAVAPVGDAQSPVDVAIPPPLMMDAALPLTPDGAIETRRVFLTSTETNAMFAGVTGASSLCTAAATRGGLGGGPWVAWLSGDGLNAIDRIVFNGTYVLLDGTTVVVHDKGVLTTGQLSHPINMTEDKKTATSPSNQPWVWTGTLPNATASNYRCGDWTNKNFPNIGLMGSFDQLNAHWTANDGAGGVPGLGCQFSARFYCFEQ